MTNDNTNNTTIEVNCRKSTVENRKWVITSFSYILVSDCRTSDPELYSTSPLGGKEAPETPAGRGCTLQHHHGPKGHDVKFYKLNNELITICKILFVCFFIVFVPVKKLKTKA